MTSWSPEARGRFEAAILTELEHDGITAAPIPGSLYVNLGGSSIMGPRATVSWLEQGPTSQDSRRHVLPAAAVGRVLLTTADMLIEPTGGAS